MQQALDHEMRQRALELGGLVMGGPLAGAPRGALGAGPVRGGGAGGTPPRAPPADETKARGAGQQRRVEFLGAEAKVKSPGQLTPEERMAPYPEAKFPQYADQYPPVGPPTMKLDKKKGTIYPAKELPPETKAFQAELQSIQRDMDQNGYKPFFNPSERYHADPTHYPPNVDTRSIMPKRQATIEKHLPKIDNPEVRARLNSAYDRGLQITGAEHFSAIGQVEQRFVDELGPKAGRQGFRDFIAAIAATTAGADPKANLRMALWGNYLRRHGLTPPAETHQYPYPVGGRYAGSNMTMHQKVMQEGGLPALGAKNPKRLNYARNLAGKRDDVMMDEQLTSGMTPGVRVPPPGQYGLYERVVRDEAGKRGVPGADYADPAWAAFRGHSKPMIVQINDAIERTHRLTGRPREEVFVRGFIKSDIPVYGAAGLLFLPGSAPQREE